MSVALQRRIRNVRRQLRRIDATPEKGTRFAGLATEEGFAAPGAWQLANQLVLAFVYSDHCSAAAADFLRGYGRRQKRSWKMAFEDAKEAVEWTYIHYPLPELVKLTQSPLSLCSQTQVLHAARYVTEWRLVAWLLKQNRRGIAPSRRMLADAAVAAVPAAVPEELRQSLTRRLRGNARQQRKWFSRFRATWRARLGRLRLQHVVPQEEMRQKARSFQTSSAKPVPGCFLKAYKPGPGKWVLKQPPKTSLQGSFFKSWPLLHWPERLLLVVLDFGPLASISGLVSKMFSEPRVSALPSKAVAFWKWCNYTVACAADVGKEAVFVNMDETSVGYPHSLVGTVMADRSHTCVEHATLSQRRARISLLASISSDARLQSHLPQLILASEKQLTKKVLASLEPLPPNVVILRQKSAWNSAQGMCVYIGMLRDALAGHIGDRTLVLLVDTARQHVHPDILHQAQVCQIKLQFVPALMTMHLQPLDLVVFSVLKRSFQELWRETLEDSCSANMERLLRVLLAAIGRVLCASTWAAAFQRAGVTDRQRFVCQVLLQKLGFTPPLQLPLELPRLDEAAAIFPRNIKLDVRAYLYWDGEDKVLPANVTKRLPALS